MKVITIGRDDKGNDRVIIDPHASRHHLQIIQHDDGHFSLLDFGSTNGTYINGQKIKGEVPLNDMDIVRIGNTPIPWRMYFDTDEYHSCQNTISLPVDDVSSMFPGSMITESNECHLINGWLAVFSIIVSLMGVGLVTWGLLLFGGKDIEIPKELLLVLGIVLIVLSFMFLFRVFRKKMR